MRSSKHLWIGFDRAEADALGGGLIGEPFGFVEIFPFQQSSGLFHHQSVPKIGGRPRFPESEDLCDSRSAYFLMAVSTRKGVSSLGP